MMIRELLSYIYLKHFSAWVFTCVLLLFFSMPMRAQTLVKGDIDFVGYSGNSPRGITFVTWVKLSPNKEIVFSENGYHSNGTLRWQKAYGIWKNTTGSDIPVGKVICLSNVTAYGATRASLGTYTGFINTGSSDNFTLSSSSGGHVFAYEGGTFPGVNTDPYTFNGTILAAMGFQGANGTLPTSWLNTTTYSAGTNVSGLPSSITVAETIFITAASAAEYQVRTGKTVTQYKAELKDASKWTKVTTAVNAFNLTALVNLPTATNVNHTGTLQVGQTLTGNYDYADDNAENGSTFKWYRSDNAAGLNKTAIASATAKTYVLVTADLNKHISFEVTPRDLTEVVGVAAESSLRGPITSGVLPVVLSSFIVRAENNMVKLNWQTTSETNNKGFIIYRSGDDKQVIQIGEISARANESSLIYLYAFTDKQPLNGNNYYKLVQVDLDGKQTELGEKIINFNFSGAAVEVSPNPTEGKVTVRFNSGSYQVLTVVGLDGKVLQTLKLQPTSSNAEIDLTGYAKGVYFVKLSGNGVSDVQKVVKQ